MAPIAKLFVEIGSNITGFQRGMNQVDNHIKQTERSSNILTNALSTGLGMVAVQAVNKLQTAIGGFFESGKAFNSLEENSTMAFETMLDSTQKAKSFLEDLKRFAERTPFELPGLINTSQKLKAFGFETQKILPMLTSIGNATAGLGGSPELLNRITVALGQIKAKGKVQAQEMMQLTEAGIPAWEMLASAIGVSIPEAMKLSEKGAIQADTAINAILDGLDKRFGGLMDKQSKSFTGLTSNFNDIVRSLAAQVTKPWFDNAKKGLERMLEIMQSDRFKAFFAQVVKGSEKAANFVAMLKWQLFSLVGKGINLFSSLFGNTTQANKAVGVLDIIPNKLNSIFAKLKPIGAFLYGTLDKGFRIVTGAFDNFYRSFNKINNQKFYFFGDMSMEQFGKGIVSIFNDINAGGKNLNYWLYQAPKVFQVITKLLLNAKSLFGYISSEGLQNTLKSLSKVFLGLGNILAKLVRPFKEALGGLFQQLSTMKNLGFADIFTAVIGSIAKAFMGLLTVIQTEFWPSIKGAIVWVWNALATFVKGIDWGSVWTNITTMFSTLIKFVSSIDWLGVWSVIWKGLSAIGSFFAELVFPALGQFFDWLVSWFTDPSKSNKILSAISATWTFISDWGSKLWGWVEPRLSDFFGWLFSWVTDPSKRSALWNGIVNTWTFFTDWVSGIWHLVSPYLASFGKSVYDWVTSPTFSSNLYKGIVNTWSFFTDWVSKIWGWIYPGLTTFWNYLTSWIVDPAKRQQMFNGLSTIWTGFTAWASNLWNWISPSLSTMASNLKAWIDTNYPNLGTWIDSLKSFSSQSATQFEKDFPRMSKAVKDLVDTFKIEIPKIGQEISTLYTTLFGGGENTTFMDYVTYAIENVSFKIQNLVKQFRVVLEMINLINEGWKRVFSGDFSGYMDLRGKFDDLFNQLIANFTAQGPSFPGFATGGNISKSGLAMVGEKGPELVRLGNGDRVFDHGQSMGMLGGKGNSRHDVYIHNESKIPIDRNTVREIAVMLQRELNLQGNRVVFS